MNSYQPRGLDEEFQIIRDEISGVQTAIICGFVGDFELLVDLTLIDANTRGDLGQSLVGCVAGFVDDIGVKELGLFFEKCF